ncbi:liprin-beta-1-like [Lemur catta]|uniref:liprin-beta-1-like n=1 Tax=Lemur catta TaxID=9447 RepID=UPI001E268B41|nr:liprin-beta-1-like [Lemur catta]
MGQTKHNSEWILLISVLTDQLEAQREKIRDLESCVQEHREKLNATEEMLPQACAEARNRELLNRTCLSTDRLDLLAEVCDMLKVMAMEKVKLDHEDKSRDTERLNQEVNDLRLNVSEMDSERTEYDKKLQSTKHELASSKEQLEEKESEIKRLPKKFVCKMKRKEIEILDRGKNVCLTFVILLKSSKICKETDVSQCVILASKREYHKTARPRTAGDSP